jgi:uncharacterized protein (DUF1778 family)
LHKWSFMKTAEKTRFDARLTQEQKDLFEYAASILGSRSLTDFIISAAQKAANEVIEKNHLMLITTKRDQEVFFHSLVHPAQPNHKLKTAAAKYKRRMSK